MMPSNNSLERPKVQRGRAVLAMDCALAGAELQLGRPLNEIVRRHESSVAI